MISGYAGLPLGDLSECAPGTVAVLGAPSEVDCGPRRGTSMAPDALRKMTQQLGIELPVSGLDLGNLNIQDDWSNSLAQLLTQLTDQDITPVVLGGATDVALSVLEALPNQHVVAAMPKIQSDIAARSENTTWLGLNGDQPIEDWNQIAQRKMVWRTARQLDDAPTNFDGIPERAILWIDISVIDLGHAAGAINLNPAGMKPETLVSVIGTMTCRWLAIVITGLAPALDTRGMSELTAIETLNAALRND